MTDHEVIQAADHIEEAVFMLVDMESMMGQKMKIYVPAPGLVLHNDEPINQAHVLMNYSQNMYEVFENCECSVNLGMYTWLKYKIEGKPEKTANTMLRSEANDRSIILSTNAGSDKVVQIKRAYKNGEFKMQELGTPECDEYLFLNSLEQDDFTMNVLMFQYEWRRRHGRNIVLRMGRDPVQTSSLILQTVKGAYDKFIEYSSNPENDTSFRTI